MTERVSHIEDEHRDGFLFRTSEGTPVCCEIQVEEDGDGLPEILRSVEIVGSQGNLILSQSKLDEEEVLLMYRNWRVRPENQDRILRVEALRTKGKQRKSKRK